MKIPQRIRAWARGLAQDGDIPVAGRQHQPPVLPAGVAPSPTIMAMDLECSGAYNYLNSVDCGYQGFMGYPSLTELCQLPEYRMLAEKPADAMTRKWIKLVSKGEGDKTEVMAKITAAMERYRLKDLFREAAKYDNFFGNCHMYIDTGSTEDLDELKMPLILDKAKIKIGSLRGFKIIEPIYAYPWRYSSSNPLADDYYKPKAWLVMSKEVHASRLMQFVSRPVPTLLKPSYNFGGLSMSQMAKPYVENWIKMRNNVGRITSNFSTSGIKTNMTGSLSGDDCGDGLLARAQLFADMRDNRGIMLLDNDTMAPEEFFQFNVPLSTLDALLAQAQEHLSSVSGIPLSILLGITPTGLNASSDGEIRIYYDRVKGDQQNLYGDNLMTALEVIQLSEIGTIDPDIGYEFVSLWEQDAGEIATNRKTDAERDEIYFNMGVLGPEQIATRLAADPDSGYTGMDLPTQDLTPDPMAGTDPLDEQDDDPAA